MTRGARSTDSSPASPAAHLALPAPPPPLPFGFLPLCGPRGRTGWLAARDGRHLAPTSPDWDLARRHCRGQRASRRRSAPGLREALGLDLQVGALLCVDWVSLHGPRDDLLNFIFDGGTLNDSEVAVLQLVDSELRAFEFCDEGQAKERLRPYVWRTASAALKALGTGRARYLQEGYA
jgi:hypothetical protein